MLRLAAVLLAALVLPPPARAQAPTRPLVVMNLAAHPDDEDGLTLAYYRGHADAVAVSVIYTRGEGGQNEAGAALYEHLGAIRTRETEAAARILGTHVDYLNFYDFGFSKHADETFAEWSRPRRGFWDLALPPAGAEAGRDAVTAALVRAIRRHKPDVIFTNHDTRTAWPDAQHGHHQAVGLSAVAAFDLAADPAYHPGQLDEPGVDLWQPKRLFVRAGVFGDAPAASDVAVPVDAPCAPVRGGPAESCADRAVRAAAQHVSQGFDRFAPRFRRAATYFTLLRAAPGVPPLSEGATDLAEGLPPNPHAARLSPMVLVETGREPPVRTPLLMPGVTVRGRGVPADAEWTVPAHRYQYDRQTDAPAFRYVRLDSGRIRYNPLDVAPGLVLLLPDSPVRLQPGRNEVPVRFRVYDGRNELVRVRVTATAADGAAVAFAQREASPADSVAVVRLTLPQAAEPGVYRLRAEELDEACAPACARAEQAAAVLPDVAVAPGLRVGHVRSYDGAMGRALAVMGAEVVDLDSTALAERRFDGLHTIVLDIRAYLDRTDLVAHNEALLDWVRGGGHLVVGYQKSFEWNPGGTNPLTSRVNGAYAPYRLVLGRDRVTMEDAPVTLAQPDHVLFRAPHAITAADWDGWVQERGLYFPADADPRYERLLSMADRGEEPLTTGLLLAAVGEGTYLYSPLVWYRQLEALNPGAWRLFANLVSLPLTDGRAAP
jgi:LmbE family N-acetylglucosaminyl deacetylase